jgi:hypothetical protein
MPRKRINVTPKVRPDNEQTHKVTQHTVRVEVDGAPQGEPRTVSVGETVPFEVEVVEGRHEATIYLRDLDAAGNAGKEHVQKYSFEARDTTPPPEAEDADINVEDVGETNPTPETAGTETPIDVGGPPPVDLSPASGRKGRKPAGEF